MKSVISCAALACLAGCAAVVPADAWTFDPTRPRQKVSLSAADVAPLTDRTAELQLQRNEIRTRIAAEPDASRRQALYEQLHAVGMRLSPLERRLSAAADGR